MPVNKVSQATIATPPPQAEKPAIEGSFAGRKVSKLPSERIRRFLDVISHERSPFKKLAIRVAKALGDTSYNYLLEKRNPLSKMSGLELTDTFGRVSEHKIPVEKYLASKLAQSKLPFKPDDFQCYRGSNLCTYKAVKTALEILDKHGDEKSAVNVDFDGSVSMLPKPARDTLKANLEEHHGLKKEDAALLVENNLSFPQLKAAVKVCESSSDEAIWEAVPDVPLKYLPEAKQKHVQAMAQELIQQSGVENKQQAFNLFFKKNKSISKASLETFIAETQQKQEHQHEINVAVSSAIKSKNLDQLDQLIPRDLSRQQIKTLTRHLMDGFIATGMNPTTAENYIFSAFQSNWTSSIKSTASALVESREKNKPVLADEHQTRWYQLSDKPLIARCQTRCQAHHLDQIMKTGEYPDIPGETLDALKEDLRRSNTRISVSDMEVSLGILARLQKQDQPFSAIALSPSQSMKSLAPTAKKRLIEFVTRELDGSPEKSKVAKSLLSALNNAVFVKDCEAAIREVLPAHMFRSEALDILGLSAGATKKTIKDTYRELSLQYHPDKAVDRDEATRNKHEDMFKKINAANSRLENSGNWNVGLRPIMPS